MATSTYHPLGTITLTAVSSSVIFSNIPQSYRDLVLVSSVRFNTGGSNGTVQFQLNADSSSNYSFVYMQGNGSSGGSGSSSSTTVGVIGQGESSSSSMWGIGIAHFVDYSSADKHKSVISRADSPNSVSQAWASRWANTAPITSILVNGPYQFASGSSFALYGVTA